MGVARQVYESLLGELKQNDVQLIAVSKGQTISDIQALYDLGQRDFGENYVQELLGKHPQLPSDIRWHFIGHLQTNKVRSIIPVVQLIQSVDSLKLLETIDKEAEKAGKVIDCLLQVHIAQEESKFGMDENELKDFINKYPGGLKNARCCGLMGMATLTADPGQVRVEFSRLRKMFNGIEGMKILSMGMSSDYKIAIEEGSNMVRIGSLIFGERI